MHTVDSPTEVFIYMITLSEVTLEIYFCEMCKIFLLSHPKTNYFSPLYVIN